MTNENADDRLTFWGKINICIKKILHLLTRHIPAASYSQHRFHVLDGMRGLAALAIMAAHYGAGKGLYHFFSSRIFHHVPDQGFSINFFDNACIAVDFFFVLSGFIVSHAYADKLRQGMGARDYMARRFARLFPLMALGLVIGLPAFYLSSAHGAKALYSLSEVAGVFLSNLFFMPYLDLTPHAQNFFPINGPMWSIFFEMLASLGFIVWFRCRSSTLLILCLLSYGVSLWAMLADFMLGATFLHVEIEPGVAGFLWGLPRVLSGFIGGMLIYRLYQLRPAKGILGWLWKARIVSARNLYLTLAIMLACPLRAPYPAFAIIIGAPFLVIWGCQAVNINERWLRISAFLGWISYPVYCLHMPVRNLLGHMHMAKIAPLATLLISIYTAAFFDRVNIQKRIVHFLQSGATQKIPSKNKS